MDWRHGMLPRGKSHTDDRKYRAPTPPRTPRGDIFSPPRRYVSKTGDSYTSPRSHRASSRGYDSTTWDSDASRRSDTKGIWRSVPSRSHLPIDHVDWVATKSKLAGGVFGDSTKIRYIANYSLNSRDKVIISEPLNPWKVLGLQSSDVPYPAIKAAFKMKVNKSDRQNRAMVSIANHMLTSSADRYTRKYGTDEFIVGRHDHFILAACGHTVQLDHEIAKRGSLVQVKDEYGRTLLYIASKSGFYDTCKMLLQRGASVDEAQITGSTPLHAAAYFSHAQVVGLLLQHGARPNIRNNFGNTAQEENTDSEIERLIQTASFDQISSLAADLREKNLVSSVRVIEYRGQVIAKELIRNPRVLDAHTQSMWDNIGRDWHVAWHGTRYAYLESIIKKGLLPAGSGGINPEAGHFRLGEEHFGITNWAAAIFVSPSILYAAHEAYSERVFSESQQWCVLVKAYCRPGSMKSYDPTVLKYEPMEGEPDAPEYRVPVSEADKSVILRVESKRSVVVRSLMFVRLSFLENQDINFERAIELLG